MKTYNRFLAAIATLALAACYPEIIETPVEPTPTPTPTPTVTYSYSLKLDQTKGIIIYPSSNAEPVGIGFKIKSSVFLPELNVIAESDVPGLTFTVETAEDLKSGTLYIQGTEEFTADTATITVNSTCEEAASEEVTLTIDKAYFSCNEEIVRYSPSVQVKTIEVNANVPFVATPSEDIADWITINVSKNRINTQVRANEEFIDRKGILVLSDPTGILPDCNVEIFQCSSRGSRYTDSLALVAIYNALDLKNAPMSIMWGDGENLYLNPYCNWDFNTPITGNAEWWKDWVGVDLYISGRVSDLDLNLDGDRWAPNTYSLPDELGWLRAMRHLEISGDIKGEIPQTVGGYESKLKYIEILGPNHLTGNLENHPLKEISTQITYWNVEGIFQGGVPEWFADFYSFRFELSAFSGRVPDRVVNHSSMQDKMINANKCETYYPGCLPEDLKQWWPTLYEKPVFDWFDRTPEEWVNGIGYYPTEVFYDWINSYQEFLDIDWHTVEIYAWSKYAIWCDIDMPDGVIKVNGKFGEHYEWESQDALLDYLENVRGYVNIRDHTHELPVNKEHADFLKRFSAMFN
mgnify:FL=1